ncbi:MAG: transcriptional repressor LexA [Selenomonadaceae bacterium]|nr:transcriptional repressor LexA [Selenomonadaceae bacterium]
MTRSEKSEERQKEIFEFIKLFFEENGYSPSVREICKATNLRSSSTVHGYLKKLESEGLITRNHLTPRAIKIAGETQFGRNKIVPLIGTVRAGLPVLAEENFEDVYSMPENLIGVTDEVFMLRVKGDSMINAGIIENDLLMVKKQESADEGDIVVALIEDEATVKRFYREQNRIRLQPENDFMEPIYTDNVRILGRVVGLYRIMR